MLANPLDPNLTDFEALHMWRALPEEGEESKASLLFLAARRASIESTRTNGTVRDHEKRITVLEHKVLMAAAVGGFLIGAVPTMLWALGKVFG